MYLANTIGATMEITFQLLQQQNPWWFREEIILDDEKIADYEGQTYQYILSLSELD